MKYYWRQLIRNLSNTGMHKKSFKSSKRVKRTVMGIWSKNSDAETALSNNPHKYPWEVLIFMRLNEVLINKEKLDDRLYFFQKNTFLRFVPHTQECIMIVLQGLKMIKIGMPLEERKIRKIQMHNMTFAVDH